MTIKQGKRDTDLDPRQVQRHYQQPQTKTKVPTVTTDKYTDEKQ